MPSILDRRKAEPHAPLIAIADRLLTVEGEIPMPLGRFPRRMTIVGLTGNRTALFSPVALDEPAMQQVEALGEPAFLIIPNGFHRRDSRIFKQRYPRARVLAPPGARTRVEKAVPVDATEDILDDPDCTFLIVSGTGEAESALLVRRPDGMTLVVNDIISHVRHPKGLGAKIMVRLFRFGVHGPAMAREVEQLLVQDRAALATAMRAWADLPNLRLIIPSHGDIMDSDPSTVLRKMAAKLD